MNLTALPLPNNTTVLCVQGNLDGETYGQLVSQVGLLLAQNTRLLILDLTECEYMSSAGLMALTSIYKQMRELTRNEASASWATKNVLERAGQLGAPRQLALVNPCAEVERVLNLAALPSYIPIYPDVTSALNAENAVKS